MAILDYSPHAMITLASGALYYAFKQHTKADDDRFKQLTESNDKLEKLIQDVDKNADRRHADLVNTLLSASKK